MGKFTYLYDLSFVYAGAEFCIIDLFLDNVLSVTAIQCCPISSSLACQKWNLIFSSHISLSLESCTNAFGFAFNIRHDLSSPPHLSFAISIFVPVTLSSVVLTCP
ncbi:UNVERIFIED_CONTAM: hypothetical protein K2H54_052149 [Gekko kuhli]